MANKKITELVQLSGGDVQDSDLLVIVDTSGNTTKSITAGNLLARGYASRSVLVSTWTDGKASDGTIISDGSSQYVAKTGATAISDLPGLLPFGIVTPEHFGAVRDGVTNDQAAIQAAIDYLNTLTSNKTLRFRSGTYAVGSGLSVASAASGLQLKGEGSKKTYIKRVVNTSYAVLRINTTDDVTISGITFDANGTALTTNTHSVAIYDCNRLKILRSEFRDAPGATCLLIYKSALSSISDVLVEDCIFDTGANGGLIEGARSSGFRGCYAKNISGSPGFGIQLKNDNGRCFIELCQADDSKIAFGCGQDTAGSPDVETSRFSGLQCLNCDWGFIGGDIAECVGSDWNFSLNALGTGVELQGNSIRCSFTNVNVRNGSYATRFQDTAGGNVVRLAFCKDQSDYVASFEGTTNNNRVIYEPALYVDNNSLTEMSRNLASSTNAFIWKVGGGATFSGVSSVTVTHNLKYTVTPGNVMLMRSTAGTMPRVGSITANSFSIDFSSAETTTVYWKVVE